jgi:hypothetical protein
LRFEVETLECGHQPEAAFTVIKALDFLLRSAFCVLRSDLPPINRLPITVFSPFRRFTVSPFRSEGTDSPPALPYPHTSLLSLPSCSFAQSLSRLSPSPTLPCADAPTLRTPRVAALAGRSSLSEGWSPCHAVFLWFPPLTPSPSPKPNYVDLGQGSCPRLWLLL